MLTTQLIFMFGVIITYTLARPNDSSTAIKAVKTANDPKDESVVQIPKNGVIYGLILNLASPGDFQPIENVPIESNVDTSNGNRETLRRKKRSLFNIIGSAFQSLRSDNWRECGRTRWGTTIYTNGIGTACFGSCPEHIRCGYGSDRYGYDGFGSDQYGYRYRSDISLGF